MYCNIIATRPNYLHHNINNDIVVDNFLHNLTKTIEKLLHIQEQHRLIV